MKKVSEDIANVALYRKYRPQKFKDMVGQEHVTSVLENAINKAKVSHAYLFAGSRGTGKTSVARILARELGVSPVDTYEIDAASNRGIDEIRELREAVRTLPFESERKVYIIDEVHMLTTPAFNALLKTLEEPPGHVVLILATTEDHKLPETITSRCEVHKFKRPSIDEVRKVIERAAKSEGYKLDRDSLALLAILADGAFRDALGLLQKVITVSGDKVIELEEVERVTGAPGSEMVQEFLGSAVDGDIDKAMVSLDRAIKSGVDPKMFLRLCLRLLRYAMLLVYAPEMKKTITEATSEVELIFCEELPKRKEAKKMSALLRALLLAHTQIDSSYIKHLPVELALVEVLGAE